MVGYKLCNTVQEAVEFNVKHSCIQLCDSPQLKDKSINKLV